jgi:hypothetical protein
MINKLIAQYRLKELLISTFSEGNLLKNLIEGGVFSGMILFGSGQLLIDKVYLIHLMGLTLFYTFLVSLANGILALYNSDYEMYQMGAEAYVLEIENRFKAHSITDNCIEVVMYTLGAGIKKLRSLFILTGKAICIIFAMAGFYWALPYESGVTHHMALKYMQDYQNFAGKGGVLNAAIYLMFLFGIFSLIFWFYKLGDGGGENEQSGVWIRWKCLLHQ